MESVIVLGVASKAAKASSRRTGVALARQSSVAAENFGHVDLSLLRANQHAISVDVERGRPAVAAQPANAV
jgi:hypothetical protein